ncbi:hypothetical protein EDB81DRAFT_438310 [Dactylonectria macrodidyma]|uniref:Uncharacterized protein n=1 Tax=Dactylonectria macrodidyma TaxID=307937 RepID=A0A9P9JBR8_9HYPO|nr:hypothetical protein EDB81DRAFT_438310 [Dactylonectria macrodidyma]
MAQLQVKVAQLHQYPGVCNSAASLLVEGGPTSARCACSMTFQNVRLGVVQYSQSGVLAKCSLSSSHSRGFNKAPPLHSPLFDLQYNCTKYEARRTRCNRFGFGRCSASLGWTVRARRSFSFTPSEPILDCTGIAGAGGTPREYHSALRGWLSVEYEGPDHGRWCACPEPRRLRASWRARQRKGEANFTKKMSYPRDARFDSSGARPWVSPVAFFSVAGRWTGLDSPGLRPPGTTLKLCSAVGDAFRSVFLKFSCSVPSG